MGDPSGVTGDGHSVSLETRSGVDGRLGDQGGTSISFPGVLSSPLSKGEITGSTGLPFLTFLLDLLEVLTVSLSHFLSFHALTFLPLFL